MACFNLFIGDGEKGFPSSSKRGVGEKGLPLSSGAKGFARSATAVRIGGVTDEQKRCRDWTAAWINAIIVCWPLVCHLCSIRSQPSIRTQGEANYRFRPTPPKSDVMLPMQNAKRFNFRWIPE